MSSLKRRIEMKKGASKTSPDKKNFIGLHLTLINLSARRTKKK